MIIQSLRPHHLLDILCDLKDADFAGPPPERKPGENGVRTVTHALPANLDSPVRWVVGPDDICKPCRQLQPDGSCLRVLPNTNPAVGFDEYNNALDRRILEFLGLQPDIVQTLRQFLAKVSVKIPGLEQVCTHRHQKCEDRLTGLIRGLEVLGLRKPGCETDR